MCPPINRKQCLSTYGERKPKVLKHLLRLCYASIHMAYFSRLKQSLVVSKLKKLV